MYIYHVLINALSAHMIHINLRMIFYTHVEHSPTKTIYIKYYKNKWKKTHYKHTHTDCSRNWVLILVRMEILWEEEGFQFGFKRWQGWAVSEVLWEWIPNVGSKARGPVRWTLIPVRRKNLGGLDYQWRMSAHIQRARVSQSNWKDGLTGPQRNHYHRCLHTHIF